MEIERKPYRVGFIFCNFRDRPFNLKGVGGYGFLFRSEKRFRTTRELEYFIFFVVQSTNFVFKNITLDYMTKTLNQIFFFLDHNQNIFLEKKHTPPAPFQVKSR